MPAKAAMAHRPRARINCFPALQTPREVLSCQTAKGKNENKTKNQREETLLKHYREVNWILKITIIKNPIGPSPPGHLQHHSLPSLPTHTHQHVRESSANERLCSFEGSSTFKLVYIWKRLWEAELQPGASRHLGPRNAALSTGARGAPQETPSHLTGFESQ